MDNLEQNTSPLGEADVTASQGQLDAEETQPSESTQPVDGGVAEEEGVASNPWDNDPKFKGKSPEDIYKAYKEAEKLSGQLSQKAQVANLIQEKYGVTPEQLRAQIEQQEQEQQRQRYANNPLAPIVDEVQTLKQQLALQNEEKQLDKFLSESPEYSPFREKILKLGLSSEQDKSYEEIAKEWFGHAIAQGQQDAYKKIDTKKMTQTTGVQSAPQRRFTEEDIRNMSVAELEAILPRADISNRL